MSRNSNQKTTEYFANTSNKTTQENISLTSFDNESLNDRIEQEIVVFRTIALTKQNEIDTYVNVNLSVIIPARLQIYSYVIEEYVPFSWDIINVTNGFFFQSEHLIKFGPFSVANGLTRNLSYTLRASDEYGSIRQLGGNLIYANSTEPLITTTIPIRNL